MQNKHNQLPVDSTVCDAADSCALSTYSAGGEVSSVKRRRKNLYKK